jgi:mRNA-degrading endonuclease RelE of RelBE toxin-antitoxin system
MAKSGEYRHNLLVYAYNLDKSNHIIYTVNFTNNIIKLRNVGDHKTSYGKDRVIYLNMIFQFLAFC